MTGNYNGPGEVHAASYIFARFDALPREVRDALNYAKEKWSPVEIYEAMQAGTIGTYGAVAAIRQADELSE